MSQPIKISYRGFTIFQCEWRDYDGTLCGDYTVTIDGETTTVSTLEYAQYLIDIWYIDIISDANSDWRHID